MDWRSATSGPRCPTTPSSQRARGVRRSDRQVRTSRRPKRYRLHSSTPRWPSEQPGCPDLPSSTLERGQEPVQLLEVRAKVVGAAKGACDRAQGAGGITVELGEPPLEALELRAQDERASWTFLRQLSELR